MNSKVSIIIFMMIFTFLFSACGDKSGRISESSNVSTPFISTTTERSGLTTTAITSTTTESLEDWVEKNRTIPNMIPKFELDSIKYLPIEEAQGEIGLEFVPTHRWAYYSIPSAFTELVGEREAYDWSKIVLPLFNENESSEMLIVLFVKHFKISKITFDEAVERDKKVLLSHGIDIKEEEFEPFNSDIIYTFDNEIISEYYRRK